MGAAISTARSAISRFPLPTTLCLVASFQAVSSTVTYLFPAIPLELLDVYSLAVSSALSVAHFSQSLRTARHVALLAGSLAWSTRLAIFLTARTARGFRDGRLDPMRSSAQGARSWGVAQTVWVFFTLLPVWIGMTAPASPAAAAALSASSFNVVDRIAVGACLTGLFVEALGDMQRSAFIAQRKCQSASVGSSSSTSASSPFASEESNLNAAAMTATEVIETVVEGKPYPSAGLFAYSRFPNYFGDWLQWTALSVIAAQATDSWTRVFLPVCPYFVYKVFHNLSIRLAVEKMKTRLTAKQFEEWSNIPLFFPGPRQP